MARDWYDEFHFAYARNLGRLVAGITLDVDSVVGWTPEDGEITEPRTFTVERLANVTVGVDSTGIFAGLNVIDTDGGKWTLYTDGTISDSEDRTVGRHTLKTLPAPTDAAGVTA
jgi:hypothetical protein